MNLKEATVEYLFRLGDSSLIIGHRLSEWCGHGPILEEDIAMTNIALDFVGNATAILTYAAQLEGKSLNELVEEANATLLLTPKLGLNHMEHIRSAFDILYKQQKTKAKEVFDKEHPEEHPKEQS